MTQTQDTSFDGPPTEVDDLDVEGHGMREVALGVSAAAIVASGAGAAFALDGVSSGKGTTQGVAGIVTAAQSAASGVSDDLTTLTGAAAETGGRTAQKGIDIAGTLTAPVHVMLADTHDTAKALAERANEVAADPVKHGDVIVDQAMKDARDLRDGTKKAAEAQLADAQTAAHDAASKTLTAANQAATDAVKSAGTTVKTISDTADDAVLEISDTAEKALGQGVGVTVTHSGGTTTASITAAGHTAEVSVTPGG